MMVDDMVIVAVDDMDEFAYVDVPTIWDVSNASEMEHTVFDIDSALFIL